MTPWICCHLGAREHYAVPRAVHGRGCLGAMFTDVWAPPGSWWTALPSRAGRRLRERFHHDLADAHVECFPAALARHEMASHVRGRRGWPATMARNAWFQSQVVAALRRRARPGAAVLFAHSYSALEIFRDAKARGWTTVLGQIDPGESHFRLVEELERRRPDYGAGAPVPPPAYFSRWREECALADAIVVNSEWSREMLARAGIASDKVTVIPLPYEPDEPAPAWARSYPREFTAARPLRVLFVGTASAAKGVPELLEAVETLADRPLELRVVGRPEMRVPPRLRAHPRIFWEGPVTRHAVMAWYRSSDVLAFPSHSDGFGMAQVEAQAWGLPVIASRACGRVVRDGETGILLAEVSTAAIAGALRRLIDQPDLLAQYSARGRASRRPGLDELGTALLALAPP